MKKGSDRDAKAWRIILISSIGVGVASILNPIPGIGDGVILVAGWTTMLTLLAETYDSEFVRYVPLALLGLLGATIVGFVAIFWLAAKIGTNALLWKLGIAGLIFSFTLVLGLCARHVTPRVTGDR